MSREFSCNQKNDQYVMKNSAVGCSNNASVHADVHQARWSALFEQMDKGLSEEEKQLTRNAIGLVAPAIAAGLGATHIWHPRPCDRSKRICYSCSCNCYKNCCW
ncbi:hypothetical protein ACSBR2_012488 [Camellia fascicularis]